MYIAMNRFRVIKGCEGDFEAMWRARESYLPSMRGFVSFHLLRGVSQDEHTLYSTHTTWTSFEDFEAWTKSEGFRAAHAKAGDPNRRVLHMGHPQFEGFQAVLTELAPAEVAA
jgi:heme-degrading monooxygenase HmoA